MGSSVWVTLFTGSHTAQCWHKSIVFNPFSTLEKMTICSYKDLLNASNVIRRKCWLVLLSSIRFGFMPGESIGVYFQHTSWSIWPHTQTHTHTYARAHTHTPVWVSLSGNGRDRERRVWECWSGGEPQGRREVESCNFRAIWTACYGKECMCLCRRVKEQMKRRGGGGKKRGGEGSRQRLQRGSVSEWKSLSLRLSPAVCMHGSRLLQQMSTCPEQTQRDSPSDAERDVNILQKQRLRVQLQNFKMPS